MQLNILQLYLNGLLIFSLFSNYQHFYMSWIIHFEFIETVIQTLHIAFIIYIETHTTTKCFTFIFEWFNDFFCIFWTINICTWVELFALNVVKLTIQELHFTFTISLKNGCINIWEVSHLYLNGLVIRSKCSGMQSLGCM
jgi:hypothetical protein